MTVVWQGCTSLTSLKFRFPSMITYIGNAAFIDSKIKEVVLPARSPTALSRHRHWVLFSAIRDECMYIFLASQEKG